MHSIETRYLGPTNHRGARIKAKSWAGEVTIPYDYALPTDIAHTNAAFALAEKLGWGDVRLVMGGNAKGDGYNFVIAPRS